MVINFKLWPQIVIETGLQDIWTISPLLKNHNYRFNISNWSMHVSQLQCVMFEYVDEIWDLRWVTEELKPGLHKKEIPGQSEVIPRGRALNTLLICPDQNSMSLEKSARFQYSLRQRG